MGEGRCGQQHCISEQLVVPLACDGERDGERDRGRTHRSARLESVVGEGESEGEGEGEGEGMGGSGSEPPSRDVRTASGIIAWPHVGVKITESQALGATTVGATIVGEGSKKPTRSRSRQPPNPIQPRFLAPTVAGCLSVAKAALGCHVNKRPWSHAF